MFDGTILIRDPSHYRRTPEEAEEAAALIESTLAAFIRCDWRWVDRKVRDKRGWSQSLCYALRGDEEVLRATHRAALRYLAAAVTGCHAARSIYACVNIIDAHAQELDGEGIMGILTEARDWALQDAAAP
jgi:hypothetical protein